MRLAGGAQGYWSRGLVNGWRAPPGRDATGVGCLGDRCTAFLILQRAVQAQDGRVAQTSEVSELCLVCEESILRKDWKAELIPSYRRSKSVRRSAGGRLDPV
jgi:hypothetical protein